MGFLSNLTYDRRGLDEKILKARARPGSTLKARARLRLEKNGNFTNLILFLFDEIERSLDSFE